MSHSMMLDAYVITSHVGIALFPISKPSPNAIINAAVRLSQ